MERFLLIVPTFRFILARYYPAAASAWCRLPGSLATGTVSAKHTTPGHKTISKYETRIFCWHFQPTIDIACIAIATVAAFMMLPSRTRSSSFRLR
ncbi:hypothetical protein BDW02DRAFT_265024 [Decorospora gaudefroyi]|uniref:Uncharacterized protein n=1 Tax=Decorospora gaudefroyi TaxID=184978 RepID=A0A6A5KD60_9PLEO|nr:hypothetical protein BDW02DRAFT_265024 [Decorospora gaudefroyi]